MSSGARATLAILLGMACMMLVAARTEAGASGCVVVAELDGMVAPAVADYLSDAVASTLEQQCEAMVLTIDTPGGMLDATRTIVQSLLDAPVPIVAYVAPTGARAGSAGMFITLAAHVAAMAPGTNIGAAHPVMVGGEADAETMRKVEEDTAALARAIAERRGRNVSWAERSVRESVSATAGEALSQQVIDLVVPSLPELLERLDGRTVTLPDREVVLRTEGATLRMAEMTIQQRARMAISDPNVIYILVMIGMLGILIELSNPGVFVPGGVGLVALLIAAVGMGTLPVNVGAIILLILAVSLFLAEVYVVSYGLLAIAGVALLLLGSALLMDRTDPDFFADADVSISWGLVIPLAMVLGGAAGALAWRAARLQRRPAWLSRAQMIGTTGQAISDINGVEGQVRVQGEIWRATSDEPIVAGTRVRVQSSEGLLLRVEPHPRENARRTQPQERKQL